MWFVNLYVLTQEQQLVNDDFIMIRDNSIQEQNPSAPPLSYKVWPYQSDPYCYAEINMTNITQHNVEQGEVLSESGNVVNDRDLLSAVVSCWEFYIEDLSLLWAESEERKSLVSSF